MSNRLLQCNTCDIYATPVTNLQQPLCIRYNYTRASELCVSCMAAMQTYMVTICLVHPTFNSSETNKHRETERMLENEAPQGSHYQAIFETATGLDYCRETLAARTLLEAEIEADYLLVRYGAQRRLTGMLHCTSSSGAVSYRLECW